MLYREDILKDKPDYEDYSENEVKLTIEEMRDLGMLRCGGCCTNRDNGKSKCGGCNKSKNAVNQDNGLSNNKLEKNEKKKISKKYIKK